MANVKIMKKLSQASPASDFILGRLSHRILDSLYGPTVAIAANSAGYTAGLTAREDNNQQDKWTAFLPGVSGYRMANRIKTQVMRELRDIKNDKENEDARPVAHAVAEHLGPATSVLAGAGAGAGIGALVEKVLNKGKDVPGGMGTGAVLGAGAAGMATLVAMIAAAIGRRRTKQEQIDSDRRSILAKYLLPGLGAYGYIKRQGRSQEERDDAERQDESKKK